MPTKIAISVMLLIFGITPASGQSAGSPFFYRIEDKVGMCNVVGVEAGDCGDNVVWDFSDNNQDISTADTASMIPTDSLPDIPGYGTTERIAYSGNTVYRNGKLYKVLFPGGYCTFNDDKTPVFHYFTQDHLGNNRVVTNEDGTVEQITHYYPFGGPFGDAGLNPELQPYKYNGKELDRMFGLDTYDYGARQYFPALPVWDRMDKFCEKNYCGSPYSYCENKPTLFVDNDGNEKIRAFGTFTESNRIANNVIVDRFEDKENSIIIFAHGNPNGFRAVGDNFDVTVNTVDLFLSFLEEHSEVWKGRYVLKDPIEIVLFSCSTGVETSSPSFAKLISKYVENISVYAPDDDISMYLDKGYSIVDNGRNWKEFRNGNLINEYNGASLPGSIGFDKYTDLDKNYMLYGEKGKSETSDYFYSQFYSWFYYF